MVVMKIIEKFLTVRRKQTLMVPLSFSLPDPDDARVKQILVAH